MASYIVCYDLLKAGQNYDELIKKIKSYGNWCHLQQSVWIIKTEHTVVEVRDELKRYLDANDKLFVGKLTGDGAWQGYSDEISKWLKNNL